MHCANVNTELAREMSNEWGGRGVLAEESAVGQV